MWSEKNSCWTWRQMFPLWYHKLTGKISKPTQATLLQGTWGSLKEDVEGRNLALPPPAQLSGIPAFCFLHGSTFSSSISVSVEMTIAFTDLHRLRVSDLTAPSSQASVGRRGLFQEQQLGLMKSPRDWSSSKAAVGLFLTHPPMQP